MPPSSQAQAQASQWLGQTVQRAGEAVLQWRSNCSLATTTFRWYSPAGHVCLPVNSRHRGPDRKAIHAHSSSTYSLPYHEATSTQRSPAQKLCLRHGWSKSGSPVSKTRTWLRCQTATLAKASRHGGRGGTDKTTHPQRIKNPAVARVVSTALAHAVRRCTGTYVFGARELPFTAALSTQLTTAALLYPA